MNIFLSILGGGGGFFGILIVSNYFVGFIFGGFFRVWVLVFGVVGF